MAFLYIDAFSLPFSCNYFTIFFLKQINGALGELVTTGFPHSFYPITHLLRKFLPYGLCWFILLIIIIHSPLSPPLWGLSHQAASFLVRLNLGHASLNFYEINSVYVSLNVILPCWNVSLECKLGCSLSVWYTLCSITNLICFRWCTWMAADGWWLRECRCD